MIRSAFRLCASVIIATCFACAPAAPPLMGAAPPPIVGAISPAVCPVFNNITMVRGDFDPSNANSAPPSAGPIPANMQRDLTDAFNIAPPFFQRQLCGLTGIFITPSGDSWGYRDINDGSTYLALSMDLWRGGAASTFSAYENTVVHRLLGGWAGANHPPKGNPSDAPAVTVLAALAHEYGHILYYKTFVKPYHNPPDYSAFCGGNFYRGSWQSMPGVANLWRSYGDVVGAHLRDDVQVQQILTAKPKPGHPDTHGAGALLDRIYSLRGTSGPGGRWASLFASFSPDEDFVETFKLFVLINSAAKFRSLPVAIQLANVVVPEDIPGTCGQRPVLAMKLGCFAQAICSAPSGTDACSPIPGCAAASR